ncbi:hypothetical protein H310_09759 [Aphanomyces invadans]|uniref:Serine protease n=1 Tax=Aphanomyces invadans TaxID=157072 RepID=A0A024TVT7_9STRA|nr:hypothetical protein H310_09759 [Aphanomyces invadans]ETV97432.1 hypothetical protein H310_09759 [Aphanomyces invadans]|eukprot:XP_008874140.1 hypothetical protein H310_09759 [Aphanomyces invadans]
MFSAFKSIAALAVVAASVSAYKPYPGFDESICGADQSKPGMCIKDTKSDMYKLGKPIARLALADNYYCTGWLFGSEGHMLTNNHCIDTEASAKAVRVEFDAECKTCEDPNNDKQLGCPGVIGANSTTLVYTDMALDFTLIKLDLVSGFDLDDYGYLQARATPAKLDEEIFIIGHPNLKPKRFSWVNDDGKPAKIVNASTPSLCDEPDTYGYNVDTQGGSSGSPVFSTHDNKVVALHNCGGCTATDGQNTGNKMHLIVDALKAKNLLPKDAVAGGSC